MVNPEALPVPERLVVRARALAAGELVPPVARPASTVVLLRDGASGLGLEAYVIRRRTSMAFAAGMYAFPGGRVDPSDGVDQAYELAAIRELFEETGVLLAGPDRASVVPDTTGVDFEADRHGLVGHAESISAMLERRGLVARTDLLTPMSRWVTPEAEERRYDTLFYLAALPGGQRTRDVSSEADRVAWLRPRDIEAAVHAGEMAMLPPTAATIAALVPYATVDAALEAARGWEVRTFAPRIGFDASGAARWVLA